MARGLLVTYIWPLLPPPIIRLHGAGPFLKMEYISLLTKNFLIFMKPKDSSLYVQYNGPPLYISIRVMSILILMLPSVPRSNKWSHPLMFYTHLTHIYCMPYPYHPLFNEDNNIISTNYGVFLMSLLSHYLTFVQLLISFSVILNL
jgi:hypothetical protein